MKYAEGMDLSEFEDDGDYSDFLKANSSGMCLASTAYGESPRAMMVDGIDFSKWMSEVRPDIPVIKQGGSSKVSLHSNDIWLPMIYLASETSVQVAIGLVVDYVRERLKGCLPSDKPEVNFSIVYEDKKNSVTKQVNFSGDVDSLAKAVKRFDLDNFFS